MSDESSESDSGLVIRHSAEGMGHSYFMKAGGRTLWAWNAAWDGPAMSAMELLQELVNKGVTYVESSPGNPGLTPSDPAAVQS